MSRKSPEQSAAATKVGTVKVGLDGNKWKVQTIANGTHRWVVQKTNTIATVNGSDVKGKTYLTHDNGGRAFMVRYNAKEFVVYAPDEKCLIALSDEMDVEHTNRSTWANIKRKVVGNSKKDDARFNSRMKKCFINQVYRSKYIKAFVGKSHTDVASGSYFDGNSILFHINGSTYVCVSVDIISFQTITPVVAYKSPVYGSDVAYPYAIDGLFSYSIFARRCVALKDMQDPKSDPSDIIFASNKVSPKYEKLPNLKVIRKRSM